MLLFEELFFIKASDFAFVLFLLHEKGLKKNVHTRDIKELISNGIVAISKISTEIDKFQQIVYEIKKQNIEIENTIYEM